MGAVVAEFVTVMTTLFTFIKTNFVPATVADITILHVAIWTPTTICLTALVGGFVRSWFARGKK